MTSSGKAEGVCLRVQIADWKSSQKFFNDFFWITAEIENSLQIMLTIFLDVMAGASNP